MTRRLPGCGCARENPVSEGTKRWLWTGGIVVGAVAVFGGIAYAMTRPAAAAQTAPSNNAGKVGTLVTDPAAVTEYQKGLAYIETVAPYKSLGWPVYGTSMVDGAATNSKFVAALAAFQKWFNATGATATGFTLVDRLNEQGVLDVQTGTALAWVNAKSLVPVTGTAPQGSTSGTVAGGAPVFFQQVKQPHQKKS